MKNKLKKALKENDPAIYRQIEKNLEYETIGEYLMGALSIFRKYDQGSLSFTSTKMRHVGYSYHYSILEACDEVLGGLK